MNLPKEVYDEENLRCPLVSSLVKEWDHWSKVEETRTCGGVGDLFSLQLQ